MNQERLSLIDRIGLLTALVLLSFSLTRIVHSPQFFLSVNLFGVNLSYPININMIITFLAAGMTASGMNSIMQVHPEIGNSRTSQHWLIPTLTTFIIGFSLALFPNNTIWWAVFCVGALLLTLVFWAEYLVVSATSSGYTLARAGLTALAYALFLILLASLRFGGTRLIISAPAIFLAAGLISLRILNMDGIDRWDFPWAVGIGLVCMQLGAGLHYWKITPLQYGLILTGVLYGLTSLSVSTTEGIPFKRALTQPLIVVLISSVAAIFIK